MTLITEGTHTGSYVVTESPGFRSRAVGTLASGNKLPAGAILHLGLTAGAATAAGAPTGNGAITVGAPGIDALQGNYKLVCVAAATNAGTFNLYAPSGDLVCQVTVGAAATPNDHLAVTIADGSSDFVVGDTWTIKVSEGRYTEFVPGTNTADAILMRATDASAADTPCVVTARDTEVLRDELVWHSGATADDIAAGLLSLNHRGIYLR